MSEIHPRFHEGQNVKYSGTGKTGTVNRIIKGSISYQYKVTIDGEMRTYSEMFLEPVIEADEDLISSFQSGKFGNYKDYEVFHTWFRLSQPVARNIYSYLGSKTIFNRYQFKPLLRFLSSSSEERLFIADEVGVGKTIETGIIIKELMARGRLDYQTPIMIVCPFSLGPKWVKEMRDRFGLYFRLYDGHSLEVMLRTVLIEDIILQGSIFSVVGLQLIRRQEYLNMLREIDSKRGKPLFGLVVIDEAHHMRNSETDSNELGNVLSSLTEMILMLSATPLNLRNEDLFNQMHILNPVAFPDIRTFEALQSPVIKLNSIVRFLGNGETESQKQILSVFESLREDALGQAILTHPTVQKFLEKLETQIPFTLEEKAWYKQFFISLSPLYHSFTRTQKREAFEHQVYREVYELPVTLSPLEISFQDEALLTISKHYVSQQVEPQAISLILNTHRRMVSSCIPAMVEYLKWAVSKQQVITGEGEDPEEPEDDSQFSTIGLDQDLRQDFLNLIEKAHQIELIDSKYIRFRAMIEKVLANPETPQLIVFSFFIRTLEYLERRLKQEGYTVGIIHGKIPLQNKDKVMGRYETMAEFKNGAYQILLSSEVGGEGLDFQYCHAIINYDMPYNPMRVEQRIGRIDRFGQLADKIIVANFFIENTVDEEIYDRLYRRIRLVEDGIGALEPILGKELSDLQTAIISGTLSEEQKNNMQKRIEDHIASARIQMEEFEKYRNELLSDDYLSTSINSLKSGEFISPEDILKLTELCLSQWKECKFIKKGESTAEISLSDNVILDLERFLRQKGHEGGFNELNTLITKKSRIKVIFDGSLAEKHIDYLFLSPTGSWSHFLVDKLSQEKSICKTFMICLNPNTILPENSIVFFYEIKTEGIKSDIEFIAVPVSIAKNAVIETDFEKLPRIIANFHESNEVPEPIQFDTEPYLTTANSRIEIIIEEKKSKISSDNQYKIDSRIAALKRGAETSNKQLQSQIEKHVFERNIDGRMPDENYVRLTRARINKENNRLDLRIGELQKKRILALDYRLEAIAYLEISESASSEGNSNE